MLHTSWHTFSSHVHRLGARLPIYALTLAGATPKSLKIDVPVLWPTDYRIEDTFQNRFFFLCSGRAHSFAGEEAFWDFTSLTEEESVELHSFSWLGVLMTIGDVPQRLQARALVRHWMAHLSRISPLAWRPDVLGKRLSAWAQAYNFVAKTADQDFHQSFLKNLAKQYRYLRRATSLTAENPANLHAIKGLFETTMALYGEFSPFLAKAFVDFSQTLENKISFNDSYPWELLETLRLLLDIRTLLGREVLSVPSVFETTIRQLATHLQKLQHPDGGLSLLGSGYLPRKDTLQLALSRVANVPSWGGISSPTPSFFVVKTEEQALFVEREAFSPSLKVPFSPMNAEYSYQSRRLLLRTQVQVLNDSFHGHPCRPAASFRAIPHLEMKSTGARSWIQGIARWHLEGEPFSLKRCLFLDTEERILRGEETVFSPLGFSTALLFTFLDEGSFQLQETQLSWALSDQPQAVFS
ncbi:MAG: hypothetical protein LBD66_02585, partial [Holosporales bacterium]|nr:hypothetical protein [Holosporales bacterium]